MQLLPIIFPIFMAQGSALKVEKVVQEYFKQLHAEKIDPDLLHQSFVSTYTMDKRLFVKCRKNKCKVQVSSKKMSHKDGLYEVRVKVRYTEDKKTIAIDHRDGCYFVENLKLKAYIEDCDGR